MKRRNRAVRQRNIRRSQRGAALVFALAAVIVIAILTLATGRLVGGHLALEKQAEGYSRAINIAEAAANWQLNRMSRSQLPGNTLFITGQLPYEAVNTWDDSPGGGPEPYIGALPFGDLGVAFDGTATVWVRSISNGKWTPPEFARVFAIGEDPDTRIKRGVQFEARPVGISEVYALFGQNELHFDSTPTEAGADSGATQLLAGYVGSNIRVSSRAGSPTPTAGIKYFGCRLGPSAVLEPTGSTWAANWDFPRLSDPVRLPTIEQMIRFMYRGRTVADCATQNDNAQIEVLASDTGTFVPLRDSSGNVVTELTGTEFDRSTLYRGQYRVIRLRANEFAPNNNLFRFTRIQMRANDVLLLDLRQTKPTPPGELQHSIRVLIDSPSTDDIIVTNLAYFESDLPDQTAGDDNPPSQSYFWYNNTQGTFKFMPSHATDVTFYDQAPIGYELRPELRGIVYGINSASAQGNTAGNIKIYGKTGFNVKVQSLIGNHVTLLGPVQVEWASAEDSGNRSMYVLYYSINKRVMGEMNPNIDPYSTTTSTYGTFAAPVYDYGQ